jgi:hypothetical protein
MFSCEALLRLPSNNRGDYAPLPKAMGLDHGTLPCPIVAFYLSDVDGAPLDAGGYGCDSRSPDLTP